MGEIERETDRERGGRAHRGKRWDRIVLVLKIEDLGMLI